MIIPSAVFLCVIILTVLALDFISRSPIVMGGLTGFIYPALFISFLIFPSYNTKKNFDNITGSSRKCYIGLNIVAIIGTVIGAGLGCAVSADVMLSTWSAVLVITAIGAIMLPVEIFMNELIILPILSKLESFNGQQSEPGESLDEIIVSGSLVKRIY